MTPAAISQLYADAFAAGVAEGRRLAAQEAARRLRQVAVEFMAREGAPDPILGNATGPGSLAALGDER
jgi:hypothetical protein